VLPQCVTLALDRSLLPGSSTLAECALCGELLVRSRPSEAALLHRTSNPPSILRVMTDVAATGRRVTLATPSAAHASHHAPPRRASFRLCASVHPARGSAAARAVPANGPVGAGGILHTNG
jgi:hypothetical protein